MGAQGSFSIAVVRGPGLGQVLRTDRKRISVGRGEDNDLIVQDQALADRHFLVLIEQDRWRIHTLSPDQSISVDRGWIHPLTGRRGAVVQAGAAELILYPGHIDPQVVDQEITLRSALASAGIDLGVRVSETPAEFPSEAPVPRDTLVDADPRDIPDPEVDDLVKLSTMPTIMDGQTPEDLRAAARQLLEGQRRRAPLEVVAVPEVVRPTGTNAWGDPTRRPLPPPPRLLEERPKPTNGRALIPVAREEESDARREVTSRETRVLSVQQLASRSIDPALAVLQDPDGEFATSIRLFSTKLEEHMRTLGYRAYLLTSAEPLAGKTVAACNLAFALAEDTHRRVALVEANFRNPRLADIFGLPADVGLIPLLEGRAQIQDTIVKMSDRNLVIIPSGGRYAHPGELLASPRFKMLIQELANTVDIAVVDAPPTTPFADANMLLPLLDAAVMVVAEGRTRVTWVEQAGRQLGMSRIIGALYNRIPRALMKEQREELRSRMEARS